MGLRETKTFMHSKGNHQDEKTAHRMGEDACKQCIAQGLISKIHKELIQQQTTSATPKAKVTQF